MFLLSFLSSPLECLPVERYWISCRDLILCKTNLSSLWQTGCPSVIQSLPQVVKPKLPKATQTIIFCNDILGRMRITAENDQLHKLRLVQFIGLETGLDA